MVQGREGDWECNNCKNRNYAFRSFCNRCKNPRLLVDTNTPSNSKWLPRIGDWICTGCTNNNYASREKCKKCGQPKEVTAMPAIALPGVLSSAKGGLLPSFGMLGSSTFQQFPSPSALSAQNMYGANNAVPLSAIPEGWRSGDWMCNCGFHNYSSRTQCKKCDGVPPAHGIKRLAPDEPLHDWDSKRLNAGARPAVNLYMHSYHGFGPATGFIGDTKTDLYPTYPTGSVVVPPSAQSPHLLSASTLIGKGAKQWREGDWMCSKCNNHNYASRSECNRCKTRKAVITEPISVA